MRCVRVTRWYDEAFGYIIAFEVKAGDVHAWAA